MKAIIFDQFGAADVRHLGDVAEPVLRSEDLPVRK
jgi:NADPH:quinone reductase